MQVRKGCLYGTRTGRKLKCRKEEEDDMRRERKKIETRSQSNRRLVEYVKETAENEKGEQEE